MKKLFLILSFCSLTVIAMGQTENAIVDEDGRPANYGVSALSSAIPLFLSVDKQTRSIEPFNAIPNDPLGTIVYLNGATTATVTTRLRKDSLSYYRYSVIENDSTTLVANAPLKKVDFVWNERSSHPGYLTMNLEVSNIVNKKLTVKIYRLPKATSVTTLIIYNKPLKPAQVLFTILAAQGKFVKKTNSYLTDTKHLKNGAAFKVTGKTKGLFFSIKKTDLDFVYRVYLKYEEKHITEYELMNKTEPDFVSRSVSRMYYKGKNKTDRSYVSLPANWNYTSYDGNPGYFIDPSYFSKPGKYEVIIAIQKDLYADMSVISRQSAQISFTVLSAQNYYALVLFLSVVIMGNCLVYWFKRRNNRKKLLAATQQTEKVKSELNMVRAQLNPHFVFNALSGIQNLMNKNEVEMANSYLNKFARLTRQVLDDKTMISIKDEISLLDDYLAMEQLRFPFTYEIHADSSTNFTHTEIPAMLLQPFVENAVKHGIAYLKNEGKIVVSFTKQDKQLILTVTDNGKGFDTARDYEGLGLKLSKKRIVLLNDVYKECPITLKVDSAPSNTTIRIVLAQWL